MIRLTILSRPANRSGYVGELYGALWRCVREGIRQHDEGNGFVRTLFFPCTVMKYVISTSSRFPRLKCLQITLKVALRFFNVNISFRELSPTLVAYKIEDHDVRQRHTLVTSGSEYFTAHLFSFPYYLRHYHEGYLLYPSNPS